RSGSPGARAGVAALRGAARLGAGTAPPASAAAAPGARLYAIGLLVIRRGVGRGGAVGIHERGPGGGPSDLVDAHQPLLAHERAAAPDLDDVAVDLGHGVIDLVHVRLDDLDEHLLAGAERQCALLHLIARALVGDGEV